jgi:hypothetical protein
VIFFTRFIAGLAGAAALVAIEFLNFNTLQTKNVAVKSKKVITVRQPQRNVWPVR